MKAGISAGGLVGGFEFIMVDRQKKIRENGSGDRFKILYRTPSLIVPKLERLGKGIETKLKQEKAFSFPHLGYLTFSFPIFLQSYQT